MRTLNDVLHFDGTWRTYQARVLKNADGYLQDGHIHIVAAPGSGKTTLGIELIGRIGQPVLILAPSITIREQWKERIVSAFLDKKEDPDVWISQSLRTPAPITIATYQALHSAMTRFTGTIDDELEDEGESDDQVEREEQVDFSGFDLVSTMRSIGAQVICLDECHHLRSEWWKALEDYKQQMNQDGEQTIIALTATPPYDSNLTQWNRYISMCGEIDEEITVPELVKEGSLCPHQDFVYFNYPTKEEMEIVDQFEAKSKEVTQSLLNNMMFTRAVKNHKLFVGSKSLDDMLDDPSYLSSLLIYMNAKGQPIPQNIMDVLGVKTFPELDNKWMEILLNNFIGNNGADFGCDETYREHIKSDLRRQGCVEKGKVVLNMNTSIEKMLVSSKGKLKSILDIAQSEYDCLGDNLRMLVLTDYIRREFEKLIGTKGDKPDALGVLPFFEAIREKFEDRGQAAPKMAVLCGTIVIIPAAARSELMDIAGENAGKLQFEQVGSLPENQYLKVNAAGSANFLTGAVTELFTRGFINIMVGTKSLLGEGWDSPCINSLILASFVGSFMLSNQMRGRAIRVMKGNPNKCSNIWHLVCVKPKSIINKENRETKSIAVSNSDDWDTLERRMKHFMGLHYTEDIIEDGTDRLTCIHKPFTRENVEKTNLAMLNESRKRDTLKERWDNALTVKNDVEISQEVEVPDQAATAAVFVDTLRRIIISIIIYSIAIIGLRTRGGLISKVVVTAGALLLLYIIFKFPTLLSLGSPYKRMKAMGKGIVKAMKAQGHLNCGDTYKVEGMAVPTNAAYAIYLKGGSTREKELFAKCVSETFGVVDNQRYLIVHKTKRRGKYGFYCVPEIMANNKENASQFLSCLEPIIGKKYELVYTRNAEGRKILMSGRAHAYANFQERLATRRRVKSPLE